MQRYSRRWLRSLLLIPIVALLAVVVPALLLSWSGAASVALGETVPPPTGVPATEVPPTATPTPRVTMVPTFVPTALPTVAPTRTPPRSPLPTPAATPRPGARPAADGRVRINGVVLQRVLGDRRSATVYGLTAAGALYRSNNNGFDWRLASGAPEVTDFILSPTDPAVLYSSEPLQCEAAAEPLLRVSADSGASWQLLDDAPPLEPLWVDGDSSERVVAAGCNGLYTSEDGGLSWAPLSTSAESRLWSAARAVEIEEADGQLYALLRSDEGDGFVAVSADGGATWLVISPLNLRSPFAASALALDPASMGSLWAAGAQGVWVTEDQGQFWGLSVGGLEASLPGLNDIVHHPRGLLFVATDAGFFSKRTDEIKWSKLGAETVSLRIESLLLTESAPRRLWLNSELGVYRYLVR